MKILVLSSDSRQNPCFLLRLGFYLENLKKQHKIEEYFLNDYDKAASSDLIIIQRYISLDEKTINYLADAGKPLIYETDDLFHELPEYHPQYYSHYWKIYAFWNSIRPYINAITVSTPVIQDYYLKDFSRIEIIRNTLPFQYPVSIKSKRVIKIAVTSTPGHRRDFEFLKNVFGALAKKYGKRIEYHFAGLYPEWLDGRVSYIYHRLDPDYLQYIRNLRQISPDIVLTPLSDNPFNQAKSSIKYLENTCFGSIGVYSPTDPYISIKGGIIAENEPDEWISAVSELIENSPLRQELLSRARQEIHESYSFERETERFYQMLVTSSKDRPLFEKQAFYRTITENFNSEYRHIRVEPLCEYTEILHKASHKTKKFISKIDHLKPATEHAAYLYAKLKLMTEKKYPEFLDLKRFSENHPGLFIDLLKTTEEQRPDLTQKFITSGEENIANPNHIADMAIIRIKHLDQAGVPEITEKYIKMLCEQKYILPADVFREKLFILSYYHINALNFKKKKSGITNILKLLNRELTKNTEDMYRLGIIHETTEDYSKSINYFLKVLQGNDKEKKSGAFFHLGSIYLKLRNFNKASEYLRKCLVIVPEHLKAKMMLDTLQDNSLVSIIIPVYNKLSLTIQCLESIYKNTEPDIKFEVILLDNASSDSTQAYFRKNAGHFKNFRYFRNKTNLGFAKSCNLGAQISAGRYLLFLNNDTIPLKGWMKPLLDAVNSDKSAAAAGSKLLFPDKTIQHAGIIFVKDNRLPGTAAHTHVYYRQKSFLNEASIPRRYQALTAACLMVKNDIFRKMGGFDSNFRNGLEDVDLCLRMSSKKYKLLYQPQSVVIHYESGTGVLRFENENENNAYWLKKWGNKIIPDYIRADDNDFRINSKSPVYDKNSKGILKKKYLPDEYYFNLYNNLARLKNDSCRKFYFKALKHLEKTAIPYKSYLKAKVFKNLDDMRRSVLWLKKSLSCGYETIPSEYKFRTCHDLAEIYKNQGNKNYRIYYQKALDVLRKNQNTELNIYRMASLCKQLNQKKQSLKLFRKLLASQDKKMKSGACFHIGEIYYNDKKYIKAGKFLKECLALNPGHEKADFYLYKIDHNKS